MADIPTTEPAAVNAGDTVRWRRALADYPASAGWALTYTLLNAAGKITITASAQGDDHLVSVPAATSAGWAAGDYAWRAGRWRPWRPIWPTPTTSPPRSMRLPADSCAATR